MGKAAPTVALLVFVLAAALISAPAASEPAVKVVTVWGESSIPDGDLVLARQRARQDAFKEAVVKVMGVHLSTETYQQNYASLDRDILQQDFMRNIHGRSEGYVKNFQVLAERREQGVLGLQLRVEVSRRAIADDLSTIGLLLKEFGDPVIGISGREKGLEVAVSVGVLRSFFAARGFQLATGSETGSTAVHISLSGVPLSLTRESKTGIFGAVARLKAQVTQAGTLRTMGESSCDANGVGLTERESLTRAYRAAAESLAPGILARVTAYWREEMKSGRNIKVSAQVGDYTGAEHLRGYLGRTFGVREARLNSFVNGGAEFELKFMGRAATLARLMHMRPPPDFRLTVVSVDTSKLFLTCEAEKSRPH